MRPLGDQSLELADQLGVTSKREVRVDSFVDCRQAQFLEPADLDLGERLERELREGRAPPQRECVVEDARRAPGIVARQCLAPLGEQPFKAPQVEFVRLELELVARRARQQGAGGEQLAQTRDVYVQGLHCRLGR